ncbi:MAG: hypothetical protein H6510_14405 [Acidobacteria bacterium]|nr:hypothetical protein [Acidobacteriota bacterium]MCB9399002.1 hypothetical protein [Acidobacteriota bacterium]
MCESRSKRSYVTVFALVCMALLFQLTLASFAMSQSGLHTMAISQGAQGLWSAYAGAGDAVRLLHSGDEGGVLHWNDQEIQFEQTSRPNDIWQVSHQKLFLNSGLLWQETRIEGPFSFTIKGIIQD